MKNRIVTLLKSSFQNGTLIRQNTANRFTIDISESLPACIVSIYWSGYNKVISISDIPGLLDDESWEMLMPFSKEIYIRYISMFDTKVFNQVSYDIKQLLIEIDSLSVSERVHATSTIMDIVSCHLERSGYAHRGVIGWKSVNMQLGDCLGGYSLFDPATQTMKANPQYINIPSVTSACFDNAGCTVDVDCKNGLHLLYVAYSKFLSQTQKISSLTSAQEQAIWDSIIASQIYAFCPNTAAMYLVSGTLCRLKSKHNIILGFGRNRQFDQQNILRIVPHIHTLVGYYSNNGNHFHFSGIVNSLSPDFSAIAVPAGWYLTDIRGIRSHLIGIGMRKITFFPDAGTLSSNLVDYRSQCYYFTDRNYSDPCDLTTHFRGKMWNTSEMMAKKSTFTYFTEADRIIEKIMTATTNTVDNMFQYRDAFGIENDLRNGTIVKSSTSFIGAVCVRQSPISFYIPQTSLKRNQNLVSMYKVVFSSSPSVLLRHSKLPLFLLGQGEIPCSNNCFAVFHTLAEAKNFIAYLHTKLVSFLIKVTGWDNVLTRMCFMYVPIENWKQNYSDNYLFNKYALTQDEIDFIDYILSISGKCLSSSRLHTTKQISIPPASVILSNVFHLPVTEIEYKLNGVDKKLIDALDLVGIEHFEPMVDALCSNAKSYTTNNRDIVLPSIYVSDATPPSTVNTDPIWGILKPLPGESDEASRKRIDTLRTYLPEDMLRSAGGYFDDPISCDEGSGICNVENTLGKYLPETHRILLFERGIRMSARRIQKRHLQKMKLDKVTDYLRAIVIVHELGHWMTHQMPYIATTNWKDELYDKATEEVHEGWAQLIDYWAVNSSYDASYEKIFDALVCNQSGPYLTFKEFIYKGYTKMMNTLDSLRRRDKATLDFWRTLI